MKMPIDDGGAQFDSRGRQFWDATLRKYTLSASETSILTEACRTMDQLDRLHAVVLAEGTTALGASGQTVVHPAVTAGARQRIVLHRLVASLNLPDADGNAVPTAHTLRGRTGASARWASQRRTAERQADAWPSYASQTG